jgi:enamine deaminase RidA (YjgF/YER057c/UK114 family)
MSVSIRVAVARDAAAVAALLAEVFAEQRPEFTDAAFAASTPTAEAMAQRIATERVWVAEREGRVVGTISADRRPPSLWIRSLAVDPRMRGAGIALRLLAVAERHARDLGLGSLELDTTPFQVAAAKVYERFGFRPTHHHTVYGTPMIQMTKPLSWEDQTMEPAIVNPSELHDPTGFGYSHVVRVPAGSELVLLAGQYASDANGGVTSRDFAAQVEQAFANLGTALRAVGLDYGHVVRLRTYIVDHDAEKLPALRTVIQRIWGDRPPAQTLVGVAALAFPDMLFEVEATAARRAE